MIRAAALNWDDLKLVEHVVSEAKSYFIELSTVTPDGIAGTLATSVGISTTTLHSAAMLPVIPASAIS